MSNKDIPADELLDLILDGTIVLPPSATGHAGQGEAIDQRAAEDHACWRCTKPATCAYIIATDDIPPCWLDLCDADAAWLRGNLTPELREAIGHAQQ